MGMGRSLRYGDILVSTFTLLQSLIHFSSSDELFPNFSYMSLKINLSSSYWSLLWVAFGFFFLMLFVHSWVLDINSFLPRTIKLGHILWWNSSADSWNSENNSNRIPLQPFNKHLARTESLPSTCFSVFWWYSIEATWYHGLLGERRWLESSLKERDHPQSKQELRGTMGRLLDRSGKVASIWVLNQAMCVT